MIGGVWRTSNPIIYGFCNHNIHKGTFVEDGIQNGGTRYICIFCDNELWVGPDEDNPCAGGQCPNLENPIKPDKAKFEEMTNIMNWWKGKIRVVLPSTHDNLECDLFPDKCHYQPSSAAAQVWVKGFAKKLKLKKKKRATNRKAKRRRTKRRRPTKRRRTKRRR